MQQQMRWRRSNETSTRSVVSITWMVRAGLVAATIAGLTLAGKARAEPSHATLPQKLATVAADRVEDLALMLIGVPYKFGGSLPESGFDCSGLVAYVFRSVYELDVGRRTVEIARAGRSVPREDLRPGDLVFFNTLGRSNSHVGVYLGAERFVHAPARGGAVRVESMKAKYWSGRFDQARRVDVPV